MEHIEKTLSALKQIWYKYPKARLGQLICSCMEYAALYEVSDEGLVNILSKRLNVNIQEDVEEIKPGNGTWNKGRIYVHNEYDTRAIKESELEEYLAKGYIKGRK